MANSYMVAESTLLTNARIFSMQHTSDIQNGAIVGKGELVTGETEVYNAVDDYSDGMYLVLNPAWSYENKTVKQNEENYINEAGIAFRAYRLEKDMKFKISNIEESFSVGKFVKYDASSGKYVEDTSGKTLKVIAVEEVGFPYCIGSIGAKLVGDSANDYGYVTGNKTNKYTIEVMSNTPT